MLSFAESFQGPLNTRSLTTVNIFASGFLGAVGHASEMSRRMVCELGSLGGPSLCNIVHPPAHRGHSICHGSQAGPGIKAPHRIKVSSPPLYTMEAHLAHQALCVEICSKLRCLLTVLDLEEDPNLRSEFGEIYFELV
jgi:hypothetical protein